MSEGGAVKELTFKKQSSPTFAWPSLVSSFVNLESLTLRTCYQPLSGQISREKLLTLPRRLDSFDFDFPTENAALFHVLSAPNFQHLTILKLSIVEENTQNVEEQLWGPNLPTTLTTLHLFLHPFASDIEFNVYNDMGTTLCHRRLDMAYLPPALTDLYLLQNFYPSSPPTGWKFPSTLEKFYNRGYSLCYGMNESWISLLPENLQHFGLLYPVSEHSLLPVFQRLPRGLTALELETTIEHLTPEQISALPPVLTSLATCAIFDKDSFAALPPGIRELPWTYQPKITSEIAPLLPRHLTDLSCIIEMESLSSIPKSLLSMHLKCNTGRGLLSKTLVSNQGIPELPPMLHTLSLHNLDPAIGASLIQTRLRSLHIHWPQMSGTEIGNCLPPTLTDLMLNYLELGAEEVLNMLPSNLDRFTSITETSNDIVLQSSLLLPRKLRTLVLRRFAFGKGWFAGLPRSLTKLEITCRSSFTVQDSRELASSCPELTYFELSCLSGFDSEALMFLRDLPKSLRLICVTNFHRHFTKNIPTLQKEHLDSLPPKLKSLIFHAIEMEPTAVAVLPPSLTELIIGTDQPSWFIPVLCFKQTGRVWRPKKEYER